MLKKIQEELDNLDAQHIENSKKTPVKLLVFFLWLVFFIGLSFVFFPRIKETVNKTEFIQIATHIKHYRKQVLSTERTAFFTDYENIYNGDTVSVKIMAPMTGTDAFHDVLEGLLEGPTKEQLVSGVVSVINPGTKLIGVTVSNGTAFVDLSSDFEKIESEKLIQLACKQILDTLKTIDSSIESVVVLTDGIEYCSL